MEGGRGWDEMGRRRPSSKNLALSDPRISQPKSGDLKKPY